MKTRPRAYRQRISLKVSLKEGKSFETRIRVQYKVRIPYRRILKRVINLLQRHYKGQLRVSDIRSMECPLFVLSNKDNKLNLFLKEKTYKTISEILK